MALLNNSIMSDQSRIVAFYEDLKLDHRLSKKIKSKIGITIKIPLMRRTQWFEFDYQQERFSMLYQTGDVLLFAENNECPEKILKELKGCFASRA